MATAEKISSPIAGNWPSDPPVWDLSDLYPAIDSPQIASDLKTCKEEAARFRKAYEDKVSKLSGADLAAAISEYEKLSDIMGRMGSYAGLSYAANSADPKIAQFYQNIQEADVAISSDILFFTLELNEISESDLKEKLKFKALAHYAPWLRDVRVYKPHQLDAKSEQLLHEKNLSSRSAWVRLFDETEEALRFKIHGKKLNISEAMHLMSSPDPEARKEAAKEVGRVLGKNIRTFALITNTLAKDKEIEDKWRNF
ncbi:MAG: oligoendopeptidase F, partial [Alphaproteobacteria bacterium]|nr:oligoendopeptidase F [Alphaproteobacteria bacterium]